MIERERRGAARWFGVAVAAVPVLDRLDDAGWFTLLGDLARGHFELPEGWTATLLWVVGFSALGFAASRLLPVLGRRDQWLFIGGCALVLAWYVVQRGPTAAVLVAGLALFATVARLPRVATGLRTPPA